MGKKADQQLQPQHHQQTTEPTILCHRFFSRNRRHVTPRCTVVLVFGISVLISAVFFLFPLRPTRFGFDAKESIKLRSTIQAHFILQKPVSELVNHIARLEYEINKELGVPSTKISILSMHQCGVSNCAHVVFGIRSDPTGAPINRVSLDMLRLSLIEIFLKQYNLQLTPSVFGEPSRFEILKFPGGITVIPEQYASIWQMPPILFSFTVNSSVVEVKKKFPEMNEMLKSWLLIRSYENVYVQITSTNGSTVQPPVTAQVSVISNLGRFSPERLRQLGQIILGSYPGSNLGLDNSVFGKIKEVSLSSFLKDTLNANPPSPSPAPAPEPDDGYGGPSPEPPPVYFVPSTPPQPQVAPTSLLFPKFPSLHVSYGSNWRRKRKKCEGSSPPCDSPSISSSLSWEQNGFAQPYSWPSAGRLSWRRKRIFGFLGRHEWKKATYIFTTAG